MEETDDCECRSVDHFKMESGQTEVVNLIGSSKKRPTLAQLRSYEDQDDLGQDIAARCEDCATCPKCSSSAKTRMVSLQEQMEQEAIERSIRLDLDNSEVRVGLPFIRDPVIHLKGLHGGSDSNYTQANRMFKANCRRIKDEKRRESLVQTNNGLVESGFMVNIKELPDHQRKIIEDAQFKHYMPWTVAEKPGSTSTPFRFAVDASITGLNEILAKGINNLNKIPDISISIFILEM